MKNKTLTRIAVSSLITACLMVRGSQCSRYPGETQTTEESDHHPEPAPDETATVQEGQGTLSPPSESEGGSVFGSSASSETAGTDEKLQSVLSSLALPSGNGTWSVYVCDLEKNTEGAIQDARMQAASLIKLYIMGAVYENYDSIVGQYGQSSVDSNLNSMITVSDNDAANTLVSYLGGGDSSAGMNVVNNFCSDKGYSSTHMGRLLLASNQYDDNYTSVSDCGHFLKEVYDGNQQSDAHAQAEFALLAAQSRRNKIPAQMPSGVSVANKTGELSDVENDAGIIYNDLNDLIIVFMSENVPQPGAAQSTIASLSRQIYDSYNS